MTVQEFIELKTERNLAVFGRKLSILELSYFHSNKLEKKYFRYANEQSYFADAERNLKRELSTVECDRPLIYLIYNLSFLDLFNPNDIYVFNGVDTVVPFIELPNVSVSLAYMSAAEIILNTPEFSENLEGLINDI